MKKVSTSWQKCLPAENVGPQYFDEFKTRAQNVAAEVHHVATNAQAKAIILDIITASNAKKVVATQEIVPPSSDFKNTLSGMGVELYTEQADIRTHADTADIGLAGVELGIAETGSVLEDGLAIEQRLITTLPPTSVVLLHSSKVVRDIKTAFEAIAKVFNQGYLSFITGPSRTSDIERVLTIGVHGPSKLIIIAVDEDKREV
jgi:L-lactate dehydrogenase complex protein LldG